MKATAEKIEIELQHMWVGCICSLHLDDRYHESNRVLLDAALSHMNTAVELAQEMEARNIELEGNMDKIREMAS